MPTDSGRAPRPRSPRRTAVAVAGAALVAVAVVGAVALRPGGGTDPPGAAGRPGAGASAPVPATPTSSTGADYGTDRAALRRALPALLRGGAPASPGSPGSPGPDPLARLREPAALAGCLSSLAGPGEPLAVLALDYARFSGRPALAVVVAGRDPARVDVFVVGAACSATDDHTLLFSRLERPAG